MKKERIHRKLGYLPILSIYILEILPRSWQYIWEYLKKGGHVLWMANPRPVAKGKLSIEEAQNKALEYLRQKGFDNMEPNYYLRYDGTVLFNFVYKEQNITIYPDLVKVKVALDNGEIVGFDASTYYLNHHNRNIEEPKLTLEEAREEVKTDFDINSSRLALIPKGK